VHIWSGMVNTIHPPLYHIALRWWMDVAGDSDAATRGFSGLLSLAGAVVLFDAVRRTSGDLAGLIAAAIMIFAVGQIDYSQLTRSYTMLDLCGVLACHAVVRIEQAGATGGKLLELGIAMGAGLLTHYLLIPPFAALGLYVLIRLRRKDRIRAIGAMVVAIVVVLAIWYPWLREQFPLFASPYGWTSESNSLRHPTLVRLLYMSGAQLYGYLRLQDTFAPAAITYIAPIFLIWRRPQMLIWWMWAMGVFVPLGVRDAVHHTQLLSFLKYTFAASFAICALCSIPWPLPGRWGWAVPFAMLVSVLVATVARWQVGPPSQADWRGITRALDRVAGPDEPIVFAEDAIWGSPVYGYMAMTHYAPTSRRPIMLLYAPADQAALDQLAGYSQLWIVLPGGSHRIDWLPGWEMLNSTGRPGAGFIARMARVTSQSPSSQGSR
jgi:4-amino-4-deoxy-L-arabinose transferase-like glycosyltransferase